MARQPVTSTPLDELSAHINALIAERKSLLAERISLEQRGVQTELPPAGPSAAERKLRYMNGYATKPTPHQSAGVRLHEIRLADQDIAEALSDLELQRQVKLAAKGREIAAAKAPEWLALIRRKLLWIAEGAAIEAALRDMRDQPFGPWLPHTEHFGQRDITGIAWGNAPYSRAVDEMIKAGVVTAAEMKEVGQ
jgi:hypothetical protein